MDAVKNPVYLSNQRTVQKLQLSIQVSTACPIKIDGLQELHVCPFHLARLGSSDAREQFKAGNASRMQEYQILDNDQILSQHFFS